MYRPRVSTGEGLIFKNIDIRRIRRIGSLEVSPIGIGCMGFSHGYGEIPSEEYSVETIRMAYDHGCTFFDTAEIYSPELAGIGHNERIVGRALEGCDAVTPRSSTWMPPRSGGGVWRRPSARILPDPWNVCASIICPSTTYTG